MPVVGFLDAASPGPMEPFLAKFWQGLLEDGFVEGQNVVVEYRWGENHNDRLSALAADLVERHVPVFAAINLPSARQVATVG
jgi:putative tryptophan/tyrosine transport system substrate-binding protein